MKTIKKLNNLTTSFGVFAFSITLLVLFFYLNLSSAHAVEEKAIFFGHSSDISSNNGTSTLPYVSAQGDNVYVVWQDNTSGNYDIYFTYSSDKGNKFAPVRNLSNNTGASGLPQIVALGDNVYVVWQDNTSGNYDIYFKASLSAGAKFKSVRNLSNNNGTSALPQISTLGNNVYVVWQDNTSGNYDIFLKRSPNEGTGFRSVNIYNSNGNSEVPQITTQGDIIYVVWQDNTSGNYDIFFQPFLSNGAKFKSERNLSNNNGNSESPHIAALRNDIYVIWKDDDSGTPRIYFKHIQKDNATGSIKYGPVNELNHSGNVSNAKITKGPDFFYGVWNSVLNKNNANVIEFYPFMLFEDYSGDAIPLTSLSSNETLSNPSIGIYASDTYLVWENKTSGNGDIFFKRLSTNFFEREG
jgi:hypothetical protein